MYLAQFIVCAEHKTGINITLQHSNYRCNSILPILLYSPQFLANASNINRSLLISESSSIIFLTSLLTYLPIFIYLIACLLTYRRTYYLTLQPSETLNPVYYGCLFSPISYLPSSFSNLHLLRTLLYTLQTSRYMSSPSSTSLRFILKYFLHSPSLIHSYYRPIHFNLQF